MGLRYIEIPDAPFPIDLSTCPYVQTLQVATPRSAKNFDVAKISKIEFTCIKDCYVKDDPDGIFSFGLVMEDLTPFLSIPTMEVTMALEGVDPSYPENWWCTLVSTNESLVIWSMS